MALTKLTDIRKSLSVEVEDLQVNGITTFTGSVSIGGTLTYEDVTNVDSLGIGTFRTGINVSGGQLDVGSNIKLGNAGVITATSFVGSGANLTGIDATQIVTGNTNVQTVDTGSDGHVKVTTEGSERLRITSGGSVNIGEDYTNTTSRLRINSSSYPETTEYLAVFKAGVANGNRFKNRYIKIRNNFTGSVHGGVPIVWESNADGSNNKAYGAVVTEGNGDIRFLNAAATSEKAIGTDLLGTISEKVRIDSGGRLLVGQSSVINGIFGSPPPRFSVSTSTASPAIFATFSNNTYASRVDLLKSRNATVGSHTVVQAGDALGEIYFGGSDGDQFHGGALIQAVVESGVGNDDMPAYLRFSTNGGATTVTERVRIDSAGRLLVGTTNNGNGHIAASKAAVHGHLAIFKDSEGDNAGVNSHQIKFVTQSGSIAEIMATSAGGGGPSGRGGYLSLFAKPNNNSTLKEMLRVSDSYVTILRENTSLEGGQISLARASDNTAYWNIDCYGSSSTPDFRLHAGGTSHFSINSSGQWVDAPTGTIINTAYNRYDPNTDSYTSVSAQTKARSALYIDYTPLRSDTKLLIQSRCHIRVSGSEGCTFGVDVSTNSGSSWSALEGMVNRNGRDFFYKGETLNHHYTGNCVFYIDSGNTNSRRYSPWGQGWGNGGIWELSYGHGEHSITIFEIAV